MKYCSDWSSVINFEISEMFFEMHLINGEFSSHFNSIKIRSFLFRSSMQTKINK